MYNNDDELIIPILFLYIYHRFVYYIQSENQVNNKLQRE